MEVVIPHVVLPPEFDLRDLDRLAKEFENTNGSYFWKLAHFLEEETQALRTKIPPHDIPNWEDYFDASRDQVKSTLESIWYNKFDIDIYRNKFLKLVEMKKGVETKLNVLKRGMDELPLWRKVALNYDNELVPKFEEARDSALALVPMWLELRELSDLYDRLNADYDRTTTVNQMRLFTQSIDLFNYDGDRNAGFYMRCILIRRQQAAIHYNQTEWHGLEVLRGEVLDMYSFRRKWYDWCLMQMIKLGLCHLIFRVPRKLSISVAVAVIVLFVSYVLL